MDFTTGEDSLRSLHKLPVSIGAIVFRLLLFAKFGESLHQSLKLFLRASLTERQDKAVDSLLILGRDSESSAAYLDSALWLIGLQVKRGEQVVRLRQTRIKFERFFGRGDSLANTLLAALLLCIRSEERRVGKEC